MASTQDIIAKVGDLPSLPTVAARINAEIENDAMSAKMLADIIAEDQALASRTLRLANSAFYGMPRQIASIDRAVMVLGFETVKNLALSLSIFSFFRQGASPTIDVAGLWNHSLGTAVCARVLVSRVNPKLAELAFLLGIVHDVGKIVLITQCLSDMEHVGRLMLENAASQEEAEREVFGFTHQSIGALLAREWKFPEAIAVGIKVHHDLPPEFKGDAAHADAVRAVCVGNQLAKVLAMGLSTNANREAIPSVLWGHLGVSRQDLPGISTVAREDYRTILQSWHMEG